MVKLGKTPQVMLDRDGMTLSALHSQLGIAYTSMCGKWGYKLSFLADVE